MPFSKLTRQLHEKVQAVVAIDRRQSSPHCERGPAETSRDHGHHGGNVCRAGAGRGGGRGPRRGTLGRALQVRVSQPGDHQRHLAPGRDQEDIHQERGAQVCVTITTDDSFSQMTFSAVATATA